MSNVWTDEFLREIERDNNNNYSYKGMKNGADRVTSGVNTAPSPLHEAAVRQVELVGRQMEYFAQHRGEWPPAERLQRFEKLLTTHARLEALQAGPAAFAAAGWEASSLDWVRVGREPVYWQSTDSEKLAQATFRQVYELVGDASLAAWEALAPLEGALNEALAADDPEAVIAACAALLDQAYDLRPAAPPAPADDYTLRREVFAAGAAAGFPEVALAVGVSLLAGREHWLRFCEFGGTSPDQLQAALAAVAALAAADTRRAA